MFKKSISVTRTFAYLYIGLQTIFAVIWMCVNLIGYYPEKLSTDYIEAAANFVIDDYMGIMYALVLAPIVLITKNVYAIHAIISVLQTVLVFGSFLYFSDAFFQDEVKRIDRVILSLFAVTIPPVIQICFSVLPNALTLSLMLLLFAGAGKLAHSVSLRDGIVTVFAALFMALTLTDYAIMAGILIIPVIIYLVINKKTTALLFIGGAVVVLILGASINLLVTAPESYGRVERSVSVYVHQRLSWPNLFELLSEFKTRYGYDSYQTMNLAKTIPEKFFEEYLMGIKTNCPGALTDGTLLELSKKTFGARKTEVFSGILFDAFSYFLPLVSAVCIRVGNISDTLFPMLFSQFVKKAFGISGVYFWAFETASLISFVLASLRIKKAAVKAKIKPLLYLVFVFAATAIYYTFFGIRGYDYRNVPFALAIPSLLAFYTMIKKDYVK